MNEKQAQAPDGYWKDAKGHLVPESLIKPIDRERDNLVRALVKDAQELSEVLGRFKARAFGDIAAFVDLSTEQYGAALGGKKGNLTLYSFDGKYKINRASQDKIGFDERLQAARAKIDECLADWTAGARPELQVIVNEAFATDKQGQINTGRVLALRRYDIQDERWKEAMTAIGEAVQVVASRSYIRVYERVGDTDQYRPIPLDIAGA
ncbi:DUF3164 family protein [Chromobacterium sphagni]|uniref:Sulfate transporter n=1 Tax=Chromobacterium sphagni TaxID=1903179 RepID=A0ABX3CGG7_9NEIS|nr:DUF3164 family protein [Chromobacterium sphagni]OHX21218.1 sulfate transporter [Chromobacterium sphagni]